MPRLAIWMVLISPAMFQAPEKPAKPGDRLQSKLPALPPPVGQTTQPGDRLQSPATGPITDIFEGRDTQEFKAAIIKGREEADRELAAGEAKIWTFGLVAPEGVVRETGLCYASFGCSGDDETMGRVKGHEDRLKEYIRDHGLPKNSFKPWEKELFGLADYVAARARIEKPIRLTVGGPEARSPDGQFVLQIAKRIFIFPPADKAEPAEGVFLIVNGHDHQDDWIHLNSDESELTWGPNGSWFAVLRGKRQAGPRIEHMALDLREGRTMRIEMGKE